LTVFVLDNSVAMRWCFENSTHPYADTVLQTLGAGRAIVPVLWRYEVSSVLAKAQKDGILTDIKVSGLLTALQSLNIQLDRDGADYILTDVHRLAVAHRLTSYDAAYLELATRKKLPLATLDAELIRVCNRIGHPLL
jgi:predicted nucleic acid-binding protein